MIRLLLIFPSLCILSCSGGSGGRDFIESTPKESFAIAYNVLTDGDKDNYEVFTMNLDGSGKRNVTNLPGVEWTYYSYKDKLFFISDKDTCRRCYFLYETNHRGDAPQKVSGIQLADSWMSSRKNGTELVVKPHRSVDSVLYIIDVTGNVLQRIETGLPYSSDPLFVGNGERIVFRGGMTKSKLVDGFDEALYIIGADGANRMRLTHYPAGDTTAGKFGYKAGPPKLHPSGEFITYQSKQEGKYSLYAVTLDGSREWKLTGIDQNEGWHDWSPDGKYLAIELFDNDQTQFQIGLMNWETKEVTILTDTMYRFQQAPNFIMKSSFNHIELFHPQN